MTAPVKPWEERRAEKEAEFAKDISKCNLRNFKNLRIDAMLEEIAEHRARAEAADVPSVPEAWKYRAIGTNEWRVTLSESWAKSLLPDSVVPLYTRPAPSVKAVGAVSDVPAWAIAEFWSSANPGRKVRMLAEGDAELEAWGKRSDFIRWVYPTTPQPAAAPSGEDELRVELKRMTSNAILLLDKENYSSRDIVMHVVHLAIDAAITATKE